ncbi:hypothetical protein [Paenibacillus monticola]|uniref:Uncharacterized protein n=1 Tax=Paenibacillus monticola TaxID=2666075 RepID=A0A7X2H8F3_9BACL|nr:hypothetical protein [Paenibacillus monticola]MRN55451.1 hypothetical protein [Paenibacillus monticola]
MYKSHVVAGRIIEINADRVLTQQGDMFCTYHPRYYMLPAVETWTEAECDPEEDTATQKQGNITGDLPKRRWNPIKSWFSLQKKSANRI